MRFGYACLLVMLAVVQHQASHSPDSSGQSIIQGLNGEQKNPNKSTTGVFTSQEHIVGVLFALLRQ